MADTFNLSRWRSTLRNSIRRRHSSESLLWRKWFFNKDPHQESGLYFRLPGFVVIHTFCDNSFNLLPSKNFNIVSSFLYQNNSFWDRCGISYKFLHQWFIWNGFFSFLLQQHPPITIACGINLYSVSLFDYLFI